MTLFGGDMKKSKSDGPKLAIIGGSGMCTFPELTRISSVRPNTKYGLTSDEISLCEFNGQPVAFLPRHGSEHTLAPHVIPYKANILALKEIGVERIIATCIVGSLKKQIPPGSFVLPDQFVNLTYGRDDYSGPDNGSFIHLPMADPYCSQLRRLITNVAQDVLLPLIPNSTVAVIQGPRFNTRAESQWQSAQGWDIVNMTQYPECYFARELGLCYATVASVTDYDVGLQEELVMDHAHRSQILEIFQGNIQKTKLLLMSILSSPSHQVTCSCAAEILKCYYES